ncbi:hypothetical protein [Arthrobacter sp. ISL-72]|uniref:hypothetical protein n=1 Tax=Arthrobacter sp. ISL-72 TaxID=2819114 RepID=UPI001BEAD4CB|nr:hypothetical protein [Arthrobacter sp. ISL-72]MBT2594745.1 hypothetical protein [Arthrobacter sp. ISL-72]
MTSCTTEDCHRLTTLYLCTSCIVELDSLLEDVGALVRLIDGPIARTSVTRNAASSGGGGGHPGSKPAINLDAMLLKAWLCQLPARAHAEAMDNPKAGETLYMARIWVKQARDLVWGPEDHRVYGECGEELDPSGTQCDGQLTAHPDDLTVKCKSCGTVHEVRDILARLRERARGKPMSPREVREYLQQKARVSILKKDFENWVQLGRLRYVLDHVSTIGTGRRLYFPGDVLAVFEDMRGRRRYGR